MSVYTYNNPNIPPSATYIPPFNLAQAASSSAASSANGPSSVNDPPSLLTPQALMDYCASSLSSLDSQMESIFQQQQDSSTLTNTINQIADSINNFTSTSNSSGLTSTTTPSLSQVETQIVSAISAAGGPKTTTGSDLMTALNNLDPNAKVTQASPPNGPWTLSTTPATSASGDDVTNAVKSLQDAASDVDADAQLGMITVQSLMSQQQTAVQIATNLVQALGQTDQAIAANVGKSG